MQIIFVFVNLALVEAHLPGPLWFVLGAIFWLALIGITIAGSGLVCGTMCWIGAIQDIFEPFARTRIRLDARLGRSVVLGLLILWMPIGWLVVPNLAVHDTVPVQFSLAWERHLFGFALAAIVAGSVVFLGKRGICRYLCPFNTIVASFRRVLSFLAGRWPRTPRTVPTSIAVSSCTGDCAGCGARDAATTPAILGKVTIS